LAAIATLAGSGAAFAAGASSAESAARPDIEVIPGTADEDSCGQVPAYCKPGQVCDLDISINGKPAATIIAQLKKQSKPVSEFTDMGLTIYQSADKLLRCDATDESAPFCQIYLDVPKRRLKAGEVCE
jgi:hypothetical protein